jgi:HlyD family secretion protein
LIQGTSAIDRPVERRRGWSRNRALAAGAIVLLLGIGWWTLPRLTRWMGSDRSADLSRLRLGEVSRGALERDLAVDGRIVAALHPTLFSPAAGLVVLNVQAGATVARGALLARIQSPEIDSRLQQERSRLLSLQGELERQKILARRAGLETRQAIDLLAVRADSARRAMARAERSREEGILNAVEFEKAQDELRLAELEHEAAKRRATLEEETLAADLRSRELEVERQRLLVAESARQADELLLRAPFDGQVSRVDVQDRDAVTPGKAILTVVDLSAFEVEIGIPEAYADEISLGTPAVLRYEGQEYPGTVRTLSPEVQGSEVRGTVAFAGATPAGLKQNQRVPARLLLERREDVLKVPRGPFLESGGGRLAYVVADDLAVRRPIQVGALSVTEVEILSGLEEGETIVISDTARFESAERVYLHR